MVRAEREIAEVKEQSFNIWFMQWKTLNVITAIAISRLL